MANPSEPTNKRNNPLGQRVPSGKVGTDPLEHNQSAELVEEVRKKADKIQGQNINNPPPANSNPTYDITGPDRQPGKKAVQSDLGKQPRKSQQGQYTQDNEEEGPHT